MFKTVIVAIQFIVDNIKGHKASHNIDKRIEKIPCIIWLPWNTPNNKKNYRKCTDSWKLVWQRNQEGSLKICRIKFKDKYSISKLMVTSDSSSWGIGINVNVICSESTQIIWQCTLAMGKEG